MALICFGWGGFLAIRPQLAIALLHRGEERSIVTRNVLGLWWNRWLSYPPAVAVFGVMMVVGGVLFIRIALIGRI